MSKFALMIGILNKIGPAIEDGKITIGEIVELVIEYLKDSGLWEKSVYELK